MHARRLQYKDRWFCYLDLLGFKNLVHNTEVGRVIDLYDDAIAHLDRSALEKKPLVELC